mmetsp:Transcript_7238/g.19877  ORF Transcript_7238/g.19877 Transcript_7238/m.19877 type:complete len:251 (+) Transcript_7238:1190-1942(+)
MSWRFSRRHLIMRPSPGLTGVHRALASSLQDLLRSSWSRMSSRDRRWSSAMASRHSLPIFSWSALDCRHMTTRPLPAGTPEHNTCLSDAHLVDSPYLYLQSPVIQSSRVKSLSSHVLDAFLRLAARQVHSLPSPGSTSLQCFMSSSLHARVRLVSCRMSLAAATMVRCTSALQVSSSIFSAASWVFRHSSTPPLALTLALAAFTASPHSFFTVGLHAFFSLKSSLQSAALRTPRRSRTARHSALNLASRA